MSDQLWKSIIFLFKKQLLVNIILDALTQNAGGIYEGLSHDY